MFGGKDPAPPLHTPPVATVTLPLNTTFALFAQRVTSTPAFAVGAAVKFNTIASDTATQLLLPVVVNTRVTEPFAISVAVGA